MELIISQRKCSLKLKEKYIDAWSNKTISLKVKDGAIIEYPIPHKNNKKGVKYSEVEALFLNSLEDKKKSLAPTLYNKDKNLKAKVENPKRGSLVEVRAEKEYWLSRLAKLKTLQLEDKLILKEDVRKDAQSLGKQLQTKLTKLGSRISHVVTNKNERIAVETLCLEEIMATLKEIGLDAKYE